MTKHKKRGTTAQNIKIHHPSKKDDEARRIARRAARYVGRGLINKKKVYFEYVDGAKDKARRDKGNELVKVSAEGFSDWVPGFGRVLMTELWR